MTTNPKASWTKVCGKDDLVPHSGVAALIQNQQVALFYIPGFEEEVFAVGNHDPFSGANIIARGLIGDRQGEPMVASPLYKQHFSLKSGLCFEDNEVNLPVWPIRLKGDVVEILQS